MSNEKSKPKRIDGAIYRLASLKEDHERRTRYLTRADLIDIINSWGDTKLVAEILDVPTHRVLQWIGKGTIKATVGPDGAWYIPIAQLQDVFDLGYVPKKERIRRKEIDPTTLRRDREGGGEIPTPGP